MIPGDVIEAAGRRLAAAARQPARVLPFGSHARGDAGPDSDLDFLVIERDVPNRHAEMVRLGREVASLGVPIDVLVVSEAYAEEWGREEHGRPRRADRRSRVCRGELTVRSRLCVPWSTTARSSMRSSASCAASGGEVDQGRAGCT